MSQNDSNQQPNLEKATNVLESDLTKGDVVRGRRTRSKAGEILPAVKAELDIKDIKNSELDRPRNRPGCLMVSTQLQKGQMPGPTLHRGQCCADDSRSRNSCRHRLSGARVHRTDDHVANFRFLAGILALQKTLSAWEVSRQRYGVWYKAAADLKTLYYGTISKWNGIVTDQLHAFITDLEDRTDKARKIMSDEQQDYYNKLTMPTMDVLDMLTSTDGTVNALVQGLLRRPPPSGSVAQAGANLPVAPQPVVRDTNGASDINTADSGGGQPAASRAGAADVALIPASFVASAVAKPVVTGVLTDQAVNICASLRLANAADIDNMFAAYNGFIGWFNEVGGKMPAFAASQRTSVKDAESVRNHFAAFWNLAPVAFADALGLNRTINAVQFAALMAINLQGSSGDMWANPELVGLPKRGYPGLMYGFSAIPGIKQSYHHANGNWSAYSVFQNADYLKDRRNLEPASRILHDDGTPPDRAWDGAIWPAGMPWDQTKPETAFLCEADFFKFRGRGIIQTTGP